MLDSNRRSWSVICNSFAWAILVLQCLSLLFYCAAKSKTACAAREPKVGDNPAEECYKQVPQKPRELESAQWQNESPQNEETHQSDADAKNGVEGPTSQWHLLYFDDHRIIQKVEIELNAEDAEYWTKASHSLVKAVSVVITENEPTAEFGASLSALSLCYATPSNTHGGSGQIGKGKIVVTTNCDQFTVWISTQGFSLELRGPDVQSVFFSAFLADALERAYFQQTSKFLPNEMLDRLTGSRLIKDAEHACKLKTAKRAKSLQERYNQEKKDNM